MIKYAEIDNKKIAYHHGTEFLVQVGKGKGAYKTVATYTGNIAGAVIAYTGYNVHNYDSKYIAIGSPMCSKLITVHKETLEVKYALDTFHKGREALGNAELIFIWDKLHELIESGAIKDIISGDDVLNNPLPVFTVDEGRLIETFTDEYGWPNVTIDGTMMHENDYFKTKEEALKYGISECTYWKKFCNEQLQEAKDKLHENQVKLIEATERLENLKKLQHNLHEQTRP